MELGTDSPAATPIHRWTAEDELRDWQDATAGGKLLQSEVSGLVNAAHIHQIATPHIGSAADRGMTSMIMTGVTDSSGRIDSLKTDFHGYNGTNRQFQADKQLKTNLLGHDGTNRQFQADKQFQADLHGRFRKTGSS